MITKCQELANVAMRPVRIQEALLIDQFMDCFSIAQNDGIVGPKFQGENPAIFVAPFTKPVHTFVTIATVK